MDYFTTKLLLTITSCGHVD